MRKTASNTPDILATISCILKDMVHSFARPQMRVTQDAIPGIAQPIGFTPTLAGEWEIACSQLCGLGHYRRRGFYTVQTQADDARGLRKNRAAERAESRSVRDCFARVCFRLSGECDAWRVPCSTRP
jgi:cytochrome c oxidase subunit 2